jgi:two-component system, cell cycle response regulator
MSPKILLIENDQAQMNLIRGYIPEVMTSADKQSLDLIITSSFDDPKVLEMNIPILALIDAGDVKSIVKALDSGASGYICKPINKQELQANIRNIIRNKQSQDLLINLDPLTGIYNRRYFNLKAAELCKKGGDLSLVMIDLDYFKQVNDSYGHLTGDEILKQTVQQIKKNLRISDILARFGGEEFALLLPNTKIDSAYIVAERIRSTIENEHYEQISGTASFGVSEFKRGGSIEDFINYADKALLIAKQRGRNQVVTED